MRSDSEATGYLTLSCRRVHSFVLGAASSLMKDIFADLATKIMDTELTILMPDTRAVELDVLLQPGRCFL